MIDLDGLRDAGNLAKSSEDRNQWSHLEHGLQARYVGYSVRSPTRDRISDRPNVRPIVRLFERDLLTVEDHGPHG